MCSTSALRSRLTDSVVQLDAQQRAALEGIFRSKGAEGFRVLALATRTVSP